MKGRNRGDNDRRNANGRNGRRATGRSHFEFSHDTYNGISLLGDLTDACGEKDLKAVPQGKSHVVSCELGKKLYFATHVAYYNVQGARELMGILPPGYSPYPGGHFVAYDMVTRKFEELAMGPAGIGIQSRAMDVRRGRLYGVTWPNGHFLRYDLESREMKNLGRNFRRGRRVAGRPSASCAGRWL